MKLVGRRTDETVVEQKLTARTKDVRVDIADLAFMDLAPLGELSALRELYLRSKALTSISLAPLRGSPVQTLKLILPHGVPLDLSPLAGSDLRKLTICGGPSTIDLAPLGECAALEELLYFEALLTAIDLAPLAACSKLSLIWLSHNELTTVDLSPLTTTALRALDLSDNNLERIQLAPLPHLTHLHVQQNPLPALDVTPLVGAPLRALTLPAGATYDLAPLGKIPELRYR